MPRTKDSGSIAPISFLLLVLLAVLCLCPRVVSACDCECGCTKDDREYTVIGIDLGITHSYVAFQHESGQVEVIPNEQGNHETPTWVSFNGEELLIGESARDAFYSNPRNTIFDVGRLIGRRLPDEDLQRNKKRWPFNVREVRGRPKINVHYKGKTRDFSPEDISAMIISKLKESAESYLGDKVAHAVVTVPAYFNDTQRQETKDACTKAGLTVLRIVNEPVAAAIAYGLHRKYQVEDAKVLVYDLGGGTLDVSLFYIEDGIFEKLAIAGDLHLGGEDFDKRVVDYFVENYKIKTGTDVTENRQAMAKLKKAVEKAKHILSSQYDAKIDITDFEQGNDLAETLTRAKFEELNLDLFERTIKSVDQVLKDGNTTKEEFKRRIVLVGGSAHIPKIQSLLKEHFGKEPLKGIDPKEATVHGAAIQGGILSDTSSCRVGCSDYNSIHLGIQTHGGVFTPIIPRWRRIPAKISQIFSTSTDNQDNVLIQAFKGARSQTKYNKLIDKLELTGIPPAPRGVPQIEVTFEVIIGFHLIISATDKATGKTVSSEIPNHRLWSGEGDDRMLLEAESFEAEDEAFRKRAETVNQLRNVANGLKYQVSNSNNLEENLLKDEAKDSILKVLSETGDWLDQEASSASLDSLEKKLAGVKSSLDDVAPGLTGHISIVESIDGDDAWKRPVDEL